MFNSCDGIFQFGNPGVRRLYLSRHRVLHVPNHDKLQSTNNCEQYGAGNCAMTDRWLGGRCHRRSLQILLAACSFIPEFYPADTKSVVQPPHGEPSCGEQSILTSASFPVPSVSQDS